MEINYGKDAAWHRECAYGYFWEVISGIGAKSIERRYQMFQSYEKMYRSDAGDGLNAKQAEAFYKKKESWEVEEEYARLRAQNMWCIPRRVEGYPKRLTCIGDPPSALFVRGKLPREDKPAVAVVGARKCSPYGKEAAGELGKRLAKKGIQVVSGMAVGVDGIAQSGAVGAGGAAFGVLGSGADECYPPENFDLYQRLCRGENGSGVISEYVPGTKPDSWRFPMRNRIISALADVLVVVEAKEKSGTFITVADALEQGKDVYAFPGRMCDRLSYGCNRLISEGAGIIYDMDEFVEMLPDKSVGKRRSEWDKTEETKPLKDMPNDIQKKLGGGERILLQALDTQYLPVDEIHSRLEASGEKAEIPKLLTRLTALECLGLVEAESGFYRKKTVF